MANNTHQEGNGVRLERYSPLAAMAAAPERISLDALAFMASIPPRYMHLLGRIPSQHDDRLHELKIRERQRQFLDNVADMVMLSQQQIDSTKLTLKVRGKDIKISQGELRKIMEERVVELEERRTQLAQSGGSPDEIQRMDDLIERYKPVIKTMKRDPANDETMKAVGELMGADPELESKLDDRDASAPAAKRQTSAAKEYDTDGIKGPSLSAAFTGSASPVSSTATPEPASPVPEQPKPSTENKFQSLAM